MRVQGAKSTGKIFRGRRQKPARPIVKKTNSFGLLRAFAFFSVCNLAQIAQRFLYIMILYGFMQILIKNIVFNVRAI